MRRYPLFLMSLLLSIVFVERNHASEVVILGSKGNIVRVDHLTSESMMGLKTINENDLSSTTFECNMGLHSYVLGAEFVKEHMRIYVANADNNLYAIDPSSNHPEYSMITNVSDDYTSSPHEKVGEDIFMHKTLHVPLTLMDESTGTIKYRYFYKTKNATHEADPNDVVFHEISISPSYLINGDVKTEDIKRLYPFTSVALNGYPGREWIMDSRSSKLTAYGMVIAGLTTPTQQFQARVLFIEPDNQRCRFFRLDDYGDSKIYGDFAIIRAEYITPTRNQGRYTGKYYLYRCGANDLETMQLNSDDEVLNCEEDIAYVRNTKDKKLYFVPLTGPSRYQKVFFLDYSLIGLDLEYRFTPCRVYRIH